MVIVYIHFSKLWLIHIKPILWVYIYCILIHFVYKCMSFYISNLHDSRLVKLLSCIPKSFTCFLNRQKVEIINGLQSLYLSTLVISNSAVSVFDDIEFRLFEHRSNIKCIFRLMSKFERHSSGLIIFWLFFLPIHRCIGLKWNTFDLEVPWHIQFCFCWGFNRLVTPVKLSHKFHIKNVISTNHYMK